jgi:ATP-dependent 26S proteasome regulatory subunit
MIQVTNGQRRELRALHRQAKELVETIAKVIRQVESPQSKKRKDWTKTKQSDADFQREAQYIGALYDQLGSIQAVIDFTKMPVLQVRMMVAWYRKQKKERVRE